MTNREHLAQMNDNELASWLCKQMWDDYVWRYGGVIDSGRFLRVLNYLQAEFREESNES